MKKSRYKRMVSVLVTAAFIGSSMDVSLLSVRAAEVQEETDSSEVVTDTEDVTYEEMSVEFDELQTSAVSVSLFSLSDGIVELADSNEVNWIDRIDLTDAEFVLEFYNTLVEASDNDGVEDYLIDDVYFNTEYGSCIEALTVTGTAATITAAEQETANIFNQYVSYIHAAYQAFDRDHPEVFWLNGSKNKITGSTDYSRQRFGYKYSVTFNFVLKDTTVDVRMDEYKSESAIKTAIANRDSRVNELVDAVSGKSTFQKLKYFNEQLTKTNQYNTIGDLSIIGNDSRECLSALMGKSGTEGPVCEGYARAFKVLCDNAGIPCVLVDGYASATGVNGVAHMWNYAQVNEKWYAVDVTWNDPLAFGEEEGMVDSGSENTKWFLVGSDTKINGISFITSHPVSNQASPEGLAFINGPVLSTEKCQDDKDINVIEMVGSEIQKNYDGTAFELSTEKGKYFTWKGNTTAEIEGYYTDTDGTKTTADNSGAVRKGAAPVNVGTYYVKVKVSEDDMYLETLSDYIPFTITASTISFGDTLETYDKNSERATDTFIYGNAITVKMTPSCVDMISDTALTAMEVEGENQIAIYNGEVQLTEPQTVVEGEELQFEIDTVEAGFTPEEGTYTLTVKYTGNENMADNSEDIEITVSYLKTDVEAEILGTEGEDDWYISAVTLKVPDEKSGGWKVADSCGRDAVWSEHMDFMELSEDGSHSIIYYIKNEEGSIAKKMAGVNIDTEKPTGIVEAENITDTSAEIKMSFVDATSGIDSYALTMKEGEGKPDIQEFDEETSMVQISGLLSDTTYTFTAVVKDQAGNAYTEDITVITKEGQTVTDTSNKTPNTDNSTNTSSTPDVNGEDTSNEGDRDIQDVNDAPNTESPTDNEAPKTEETSKPEDIPKTEETPKQEESPKPEETPKTEEIPKPEETPKAEETSKTEEAPKTEETPKAEETPKPEEAPKTEEILKTEELPQTAEVLTDSKTKAKYRVTKAGKTGGTVEYYRSMDKNTKTIIIAPTVTIQGITYKVTSIAENAFKGNKKITMVTIGNNITSIGKKAFYNCKNLKNITIKTTKLTNNRVGSKAFKGTYKKVRVKVPAKKFSAYKRILKQKGISSEARIKE